MLRNIALLIVLCFAAPAGVLAAPSSRAVEAPGLSSDPAADRFLTLDGPAIRYRDEGPRRAPVIILIHGFTFSLESWDAWAADLARDHRVLRYDLAGHGLSAADPAGRYATVDREAQLCALMKRLGISKATIAGNSLGGMIAWNFAADHPKQVEKLILVDTGAFSINGVHDTPVAVPPMMRSFLMSPTAAGMAFTASRIYAHPDRVPPATLERLHAMMARNGPAMIAHLERFTLPDPVAKLGTIKAPTLILWGERDTFIPLADATRIGDAIPGSAVAIIPDAGHAPQEEAPAESLARVRAFLSQH